jgi:hypothetical protein
MKKVTRAGKLLKKVKEDQKNLNDKIDYSTIEFTVADLGLTPDEIKFYEDVSNPDISLEELSKWD